MRISALTLFVLFASALAAEEAPLYQWQDPASGRTQMSGRAPGWYRGLQEGPRVLVFRNGVLVDDTAVAVSEELRAELRTAALTAAVRDATPAVVEASSPAKDPLAPGERESGSPPLQAATSGDREALAATPLSEAERTSDMRTRMLETLNKLDAFFLESAAKALQSTQGLPGASPPGDAPQP